MRLTGRGASGWDWSSGLESIRAGTKVDPPKDNHISTRGCGSVVPAWWSITRRCLNEALESQFRHRYYATSFQSGRCNLYTSHWFLCRGSTWDSRLSATDQRFGSALGCRPSVLVPGVSSHTERTSRRKALKQKSHGNSVGRIFHVCPPRQMGCTIRDLPYTALHPRLANNLMAKTNTVAKNIQLKRQNTCSSKYGQGDSSCYQFVVKKPGGGGVLDSSIASHGNTNLTQTYSKSRNSTIGFTDNFRHEQLPTDLLRVAVRLNFPGSWRYFVVFALSTMQPKVAIHHCTV